MNALLISEYCTTCETNQDHELDARALTTECLVCKRTETVSEHYARSMMEE